MLVSSFHIIFYLLLFPNGFCLILELFNLGLGCYFAVQKILSIFFYWSTMLLIYVTSIVVFFHFESHIYLIFVDYLCYHFYWVSSLYCHYSHNLRICSSCFCFWWYCFCSLNMVVSLCFPHWLSSSLDVLRLRFQSEF